MERIKYQNMIDELCIKGFEIANEIIADEISEDDLIPIVEVKNENPEKLEAISRFIEALIKVKDAI